LLENSSDLIGNRTRDLQAYSIVPQATTGPRTDIKETDCERGFELYPKILPQYLRVAFTVVASHILARIPFIMSSSVLYEVRGTNEETENFRFYTYIRYEAFTNKKVKVTPLLN
jgi:hypothetical protein